MKRVLSYWLSLMVVMIGGCLLADAQSQTTSLGDYARAVKKTAPQSKKAKPKIYDNDNLPTDEGLSVVGAATPTLEAGEAKEGTTADEKTANPKGGTKADRKTGDQNGGDQKAGDQADKKKPTGEIKPEQSSAEREQAFDVWKQKIDEQKRNVDQLNRDLAAIQHDYEMRPVKLWEDDAKYKQDVAQKQKAIDEAKSKLDDLQDQAHKSGVPDSVMQ